MEMFVKLNYFDGEVFIDENRVSFRALDFKRMSYCEAIPALLSSAARAAKATARALGLSSNWDGDLFQNGGCLIVDKGGGNEPLLHFIQKSPADRVSNTDILKILGIDSAVPETKPFIEFVSVEKEWKDN